MVNVALLAAAIGAPFPLLCTPYTEKGEVDCAVLAKEARFVADCGANGVIWPAADDALKLLTADDQYILAQLHKAVRACDEHIERCRFNDYAKTVYEFFWHEFCDWVKTLPYAAELIIAEGR